MLAFSFSEMLNSGALGLLIRGGFFMWPLLFLGILAIGVMIERWRSLKILDTDPDELRAEVTDLLDEGRIEDAMKLCDNGSGPITFPTEISWKRS